MKRYLNPWKGSEIDPRYYFIDSKPVFKIGHYCIFHLFENSYLYTFKDLAFNNLAGINKDHLRAIANRTEPKDSDKWLYQRGIENLTKAKELQTQILINANLLLSTFERPNGDTWKIVHNLDQFGLEIVDVFNQFLFIAGLEATEDNFIRYIKALSFYGVFACRNTEIQKYTEFSPEINLN